MPNDDVLSQGEMHKSQDTHKHTHTHTHTHRESDVLRHRDQYCCCCQRSLHSITEGWVNSVVLLLVCAFVCLWLWELQDKKAGTWASWRKIEEEGLSLRRDSHNSPYKHNHNQQLIHFSSVFLSVFSQIFWAESLCELLWLVTAGENFNIHKEFQSQRTYWKCHCLRLKWKLLIKYNWYWYCLLLACCKTHLLYVPFSVLSSF